MIVRHATFCLFFLMLAACEKQAPDYVLKMDNGEDTANHYDYEEDEIERKYIKVLPFEYKRERQILEARNNFQRRRNRIYFPKK